MSNNMHRTFFGGSLIFVLTLAGSGQLGPVSRAGKLTSVQRSTHAFDLWIAPHSFLCAPRAMPQSDSSRAPHVRLLLTAHPQGLIVRDVQEDLGIPASTLSTIWTNSITRILSEYGGRYISLVYGEHGLAAGDHEFTVCGVLYSQ